MLKGIGMTFEQIVDELIRLAVRGDIGQIATTKSS